jgi:hypothetical protein
MLLSSHTHKPNQFSKLEPQFRFIIVKRALIA